MALKIETIPSAQAIPGNINNFRMLPSIEWSVSAGGQESETKHFTAGKDTRWNCSKAKGLHVINVWGDDSDEGFEMSVQEKGEAWFISYLDLDISRHFGVFNSLGFEFYQNGGNLKGAIYLHKVGREYKKPGTNEVWSYSDYDLDDDFRNERGTFFHATDFNSDEINKQKQGFILNRIYFNFGCSTSGSTGTGSTPYTECQIYNLKLGWGSGEASDNHRICLPKMREFSEADRLAFGD